MRVAYVCGDRGVPVFGQKGASVHAQEILRSFVKRGARVELFAARVGGDAPAGLEDVRVTRLRAPSAVSNRPTSTRERLEVDRLLARELPRREIPFDLVYERHSLWISAGMQFAARRGIPGILEINAPLVAEQLAHRRLEDPATARRLVRESLAAARLRVAVSSGVARSHREYGFSAEDFLICPNGVNPARFRESDRTTHDSRRGSGFTLGFLGTLKPWHGIGVLLDAFCLLARKSPDYRLLIVGDGPLREEIEQRVEMEGLRERVSLTGSVAPDDVPRWLEEMDVGSAPYADTEGHYFSPLKLFEYMAASLPVVASRVGQIRDLVSDGEEGWLVQPGSAGELAARVERLRNDPATARKMGELGRKRVLEHHTWDAILTRVLDASSATQDSGRRFAQPGLRRGISGSG